MVKCFCKILDINCFSKWEYLSENLYMAYQFVVYLIAMIDAGSRD